MNPVLGYTSRVSNVESIPIPMLNGSNFSEWKEHLLLVLALMDLDLSLRTVRPSSAKELERWDRFNRVSMMIMRIRIPQEFRGIIPEDVTTAKEFLTGLENFFVKNKEAERSMVHSEYCSMRYRDNENVREFIMRMKTVAAKLKRVGIDNLLSDDKRLAHFAVKMLPLQYIRLDNEYRRLEEKFNKENSYLCFGDIWSTSELISRCDMEEESFSREIASNLKREREQ